MPFSTSLFSAWGAVRFKTLAEDGSAISVEARPFGSVDFGYNRITVYTPERDEAGEVVLDRKGRPKVAVDEKGKRTFTEFKEFKAVNYCESLKKYLINCYI